MLKPVLAARYPPWDATRKALAHAVTNPAFAAIKEHMEQPWVAKAIVALVILMIGRRLGFRLVRDSA